MLPGVLPGHPLQKRTEVQWDIGAALGADDGVDESTSRQVGITDKLAQLRQHELIRGCHEAGGAFDAGSRTDKFRESR
jgi:hypothetical protein